MPVQPQRNIFAQMQAGPAPIELSQFGVPQMGFGQDTTGGMAFPELPVNLLSPGELGAFLGGGFGGAGGGATSGSIGGGLGGGVEDFFARLI